MAGVGETKRFMIEVLVEELADVEKEVFAMSGVRHDLSDDTECCEVIEAILPFECKSIKICEGGR